MNTTNKKATNRCPQSADGQHKPEPTLRWAGRAQVALDDEGRVVQTTLLCAACGAAGTASLPVDRIVWRADPHDGLPR